MKYQIDITQPAELDILAAAEYIAGNLHNRAAADRLLDEVAEIIYTLEEMPERHSLVYDEYLASKGIRLLPTRNYLVFYVIREETKKVVIERFLYGKRDWMNLLKGDADFMQDWQQDVTPH